MLEEWTFANAATNVAHHNQSRSTIPRIATPTTSPMGLPSTLAAGDIHVCATNSSPTPWWQCPQCGMTQIFKLMTLSQFSLIEQVSTCVYATKIYGAFVVAKTICFTILCHVDVGESLDLFHVLEWLSDMQFDSMDFVLDSKTTTNAFI